MNGWFRFTPEGFLTNNSKLLAIFNSERKEKTVHQILKFGDRMNDHLTDFYSLANDKSNRCNYKTWCLKFCWARNFKAQKWSRSFNKTIMIQWDSAFGLWHECVAYTYIPTTTCNHYVSSTQYHIFQTDVPKQHFWHRNRRSSAKISFWCFRVTRKSDVFSVYNTHTTRFIYLGMNTQR